MDAARRVLYGSESKRESIAKMDKATHTSKCSFQNGFNDFLTVVVANFSTPSTDTTTNGSGSRNRFRFGSPLALRTDGVWGLSVENLHCVLARDTHS